MIAQLPHCLILGGITEPAAASRAPKRHLLKLQTRLPRRDLYVFQTVAAHFGTTAAAIMQSNAIGELACIKDSPFRVLSIYSEFNRAGVDMVPVELFFNPNAYCLLETAAAALHWHLGELVAGMLCSSADTLSCEVMDAIDRGGIDQNPVLVEWAEEWVKFEFESKRGRLLLDHSGWDRWTALEMENLMPPVFATKNRKGGQS